MNINSYIENYGNDSFIERPFCTADAFVFACLGFVRFEDVKFVPSFEEPDKKSYIRDIPDSLIEQMNAKEIYGPNTAKMLGIIRNKPRYKDISLQYQFSVLDDLLSEQIYAITLDIPNVGYFVLFRGTDGTKIGWVENLMAIINRTNAAQLDAVEYLNIVHRLVGDKPLMVGGHSKGGNLTLYSTIYAPKEVQDCITHSYFFEGPGLPEKFFNKEEYLRVKDKIIQVVPRDSMFGELFYTPKNPLVISAYESGVIQHDQFHWKTKGPDLYFIKKRNPNTRVLHRASKLWLKAGNKNDFKNFINFFVTMTYVEGQEDQLSLTFTFNKVVARYKEFRKTLKFRERIRFLHFLFNLYRIYKNSAKYYKKKDKED